MSDEPHVFQFRENRSLNWKENYCRRYMAKQIRKGKDIVFSGVCSGIAEYFDIDPLWVRILFVIFSKYLSLVYLVCMFCMSESE